MHTVYLHTLIFFYHKGNLDVHTFSLFGFVSVGESTATSKNVKIQFHL